MGPGLRRDDNAVCGAVRSSDRRQNRETFACPAQVQKVGIAVFDADDINPRRDRSAAAGCNHILNDIVRSGERRLDAAVAAIADPAIETARHRLFLDPGAIANALHAATDRDVADRATHVLMPRNSAVRALVSASRITRPVSSDDAIPLRLFGEAPSRNAFSVS